MQICALCKSDKSLSESHIIPQFVFDCIKRNSPTGFVRTIGKVNLRRQDGDKPNMLCKDCEERFSRAESIFALKIFKPFQEKDIASFTYGSWLNYFISSVNWRTLYLDNLGFHAKREFSGEKLLVLDTAEKIIADFLLSKRTDTERVENHIFMMHGPMTVSPDLANSRPNVFFRTGAFGYTLFDFDSGGCYVCANLAGILICTIIQKGKNDVWDNTFVRPCGGSIGGAQNISSVLMYDMMQLMLEWRKTKISRAQQKKIAATFLTNPKAAQSKFFKFHKWDENLGS